MGRIKKNKQNKQTNKTSSKSVNKGNDQQIQKVMMYTGIGIIAVAIVFVVISISQGTPPVEMDLAGQPSMGEPDAPVKVVEFGDWKCPHCAEFHEIAFSQLKSDYIDTGQVEFYFVNFPLESLGPDAMNAALGAECIYDQGEQYFWSYYNAIYENQGSPSQLWATPDFLADQVELHVNPDIDREAFINCIQEGEFQEQVDADQQLGLNSGVNSTPYLFVNGKRSQASYGTLSSDIEDALDGQE